MNTEIHALREAIPILIGAEVDEVKKQRDDLLRMLKWIRKYPDVLEDKFYTKEIDKIIAISESFA